jgi:hypothetical protein
MLALLSLILPLPLRILTLLLLNLILVLLIFLLLMRIALNSPALVPMVFAAIRLRTALRDWLLRLSLVLLLVLMLLSECRRCNTQNRCQRKMNRFHCFPPATVGGTLLA